MQKIITRYFRDLFSGSDSTYDHSRTDGHNILVQKMNRYFSKNPKKEKQFREELSFINNISKKIPEEKDWETYSIYPYLFTFKYDFNKVEVFRDHEAQMFYVYLDGKKLYYPRSYADVEDIKKHFTYISAEQDLESPHRYLSDSFSVGSDDIVADFGAAEGNFSLSVVDKVKELFILESDTIWMEALHKTFEPWKNKVKIVNKYAGDRDDDDTITLEELLQQMNLTVVKMDIEGAELKVLQQAEKSIRERKLRMAITTYHHKSDANNIKEFLEKQGYNTIFSRNFMLFVWDNLTPPYFRKALILASK